MPEDLKTFEEAADLFTKAREEFAEATRKGDEATQELHNKLNGLQTQLDKLEVKGRRAPLAPGLPQGLSEEDEKKARAVDLFLRKGVQRMAAEHPEEFKTLILADDQQGGYLAPAQWAPEILKAVVEVSPIRRLARVLSIGAKEVHLPYRKTTPVATWPGEAPAADVAAANSTYGLRKIPVDPLVAVSHFSIEALEDVAYNLASEIQADAAEQFAAAEGLAFLKGSGNQRPEGVLVNADVLASQLTVSGDADELLADSLIKAFFDLKAPYARRSTWLMHRQTIRVVRMMKDLQNRYLWDANLGLTNAAGPTILDRPYEEAVDLDAPAANGTYSANALPVVLADWQAGYRVVDRTSMAVIRDEVTLAGQGLQRMILRKRLGGGVVQPEAFRVIKIAAS